MTTSGDGVSTRSSAGKASTGKKAIWGWALYDFGISAFSSLIVTFVYAVFFVDQIVPDGTIGSVLWANGVAVAAIVVALSSPLLGALADRGGHRRRYLFIATAVAILGTALLYFPTPGEVRFALVIFVIANVAAELAFVFYNSYLPDISTPDNIGKISGYGWSLGYVGGILVLGIALVGFVSDSPWFGLSTGEEGLFQNIRAVPVLVAVWFAVFAIPMFRWVPEPKQPDAPPLGELLRGAVSQLGKTFREIGRYEQVARLLVARILPKYPERVAEGFLGLREVGFLAEEEVVHDRDALRALGQERVDQAAADEARASGHEDPHAGKPVHRKSAGERLAGQSYSSSSTASSGGGWLMSYRKQTPVLVI